MLRLPSLGRVAFPGRLPVGSAGAALRGLLLGLALAGCGGTATPSMSPAAPGAPAASSAIAPPASSAAGAAASESAAGAASKPAERTPITVVYNSPDTGYLALWIGQDAGIFARNGLDVKLQLVSNGTQAMAALLSGQVQFIQTGGSAALGPAMDGANLTLLSVIIPVYSYVLEASPNIKQPADLKGKKLGVGSLGDSGDLATRVGLRKIGLDPEKDVTILAIGSTPVRAAALRNGAIQAAATSFPENLALEKDGFTRLLDLAALKLPAAGQSTIAEKGWVAAHHDATQRYVDSLIEALTKARQDKAFAIASMKKAMKANDDDAMNLTYDYYVNEVFPKLPEPNPALFADAMDLLSRTNDKARGFELSRLIDPTFVSDAKSRGLGKD